MPLVDNAHYVDSVGYAAVAPWAALTVVAAGVLRRQLATPAVGSERVFACIIAGTTLSAEPTWTVARGAKTAEVAGPTWQECTGLAGVNGDLTNTPNWTTIKNTAIVLGQIIKRDSGASYQICTTAGTAGNGAEPGFSDTAGTTTADNTVTWTSLGAVGNFTGNQAPHARVATALATNWAQAGNTIFVKSSHAETQGSSTTLIGASTLASPQKILCHDGGAYPPAAGNLTTGATVTSSGASSSLSIGSVCAYYEGIEFINSGANSSIIVGGNGAFPQLNNCKLALSANSTTSSIALGFGSALTSRISLKNTPLSFANASQVAALSGEIKWQNTPNAIQGTIPTTLFRASSNPSNHNFVVDGIDLSAAGSGKTLMGVGVSYNGRTIFQNCKLGASVVVASTPTFLGSVDVIDCDSGDTNYRNERYAYQGTLTTETAIVRSGGASDGTTPVSWKIVTTANASLVNPFECPAIAVWNETVGSAITVDVQGIWGGGAVPNDDEIWVEVEYLGDTLFPISSFASDRKATVLTAAVAQDAGAGTWGGSTTKFKLSVSVTPQQKGPIVARVMAAKVSSTFYVDPKITLS